MEKAMDLEQKTLINELNQGKQLANQLMNYLNNNPSSHGTREFLVERILSSYEKALSMLNWGAFVQDPKPTSSLGNSSSRSEGSDQDCKAQCHQDMFKKRKTLPRWTEQVRVCSGTGLEGPLDDGYSWRKYGQKEILGAHHPRGYYRCTHRHARGCLATKQVQRSDEDPTIIEVTYRGRHTCFPASHLTTQSGSMLIESSKLNKEHNQQQKLEEKPQQPQEMHLSFGAGFKRKAEDLDARESIFPSFSFPPTSDGSENVENNIFGESMMENTFMGSFSPKFISPATSESNYFSVSPCDMNTFGFGHSVQTPESDLTEIISAPTSVTNSPIANLDYFSLDKVDFDTNFPFDTLEFFS